MKSYGCEYVEDDVAWQDWVEEGDVSATCLLCSFQHHDLSSMASHLLATHQLSFVGTFGSLDFYDRIKLVNWIRLQVRFFRGCMLKICRFSSYNVLAMKSWSRLQAAQRNLFWWNFSKEKAKFI